MRRWSFNPGGLPDFFNLTADVARRLGVQADSQVGRMIHAERQNRLVDDKVGLRESISFDRVFTQLVRLFGIGQVEAEAVNALSSKRRPQLRNHRALLDLARGPDGRQRLITTNFDRLFQKAQPRLHSYRPPKFPDLSRRDGFDGFSNAEIETTVRVLRTATEQLQQKLKGDKA